MNRFATLKRVPSAQERQSFSLSEFSSPNFTRWSYKPRHPFNQLLEGDPQARSMIDDIRDKAKKGFPDPLCGFQNASTMSYLGAEFLSEGITLVTVSYRSPLTLANSMRTWNASGLLDMVQYRTAILSRPLPEEVRIATAFGFEVVEPRHVPDSEQVKPNVFTIGAAFYYALIRAKTE